MNLLLKWFEEFNSNTFKLESLLNWIFLKLSTKFFKQSKGSLKIIREKNNLRRLNESFLFTIHKLMFLFTN